MPPDHTLRASTSADAEAILVVHIAAIIANGPSAYSSKQVTAWAAKTEGTDRYVNAVSDPTTLLVIAEADSRVVGFCELNVESSEIEAIFVDPEWNGRGIGSSILSHFEHRLTIKGSMWFGYGPFSMPLDSTDNRDTNVMNGSQIQRPTMLT